MMWVSIYLSVGLLHHFIVLVTHYFLSFNKDYIEDQFPISKRISGIIIGVFIWPYVIVIRIVQLERLEQTLLQIEKQIEEYYIQEERDDA